MGKSSNSRLRLSTTNVSFSCNILGDMKSTIIEEDELANYSLLEAQDNCSTLQSSNEKTNA